MLCVSLTLRNLEDVVAFDVSGVNCVEVLDNLKNLQRARYVPLDHLAVQVIPICGRVEHGRLFKESLAKEIEIVSTGNVWETRVELTKEIELANPFSVDVGGLLDYCLKSDHPIRLAHYEVMVEDVVCELRRHFESARKALIIFGVDSDPAYFFDRWYLKIEPDPQARLMLEMSEPCYVHGDFTIRRMTRRDSYEVQSGYGGGISSAPLKENQLERDTKTATIAFQMRKLTLYEKAMRSFWSLRKTLGMKLGLPLPEITSFQYMSKGCGKSAIISRFWLESSVCSEFVAREFPPQFADADRNVEDESHDAAIFEIHTAAALTGIDEIIPERAKEAANWIWKHDERHDRGRTARTLLKRRNRNTKRIPVDLYCKLYDSQSLGVDLKTSNCAGSVQSRTFLINRILSFSEERKELRRAGILRLGGTCATLEMAWRIVQDWWVFASQQNKLCIPLGHTREQSILKVIEALALALKIEISLEPDLSLSGCLIRTKSGATIYLSSSLGLRERSFTILHELSHEILGHTPANKTLVGQSSIQLAKHSEQEHEADALADAMLHVVDGLVFLWQLNGQRPQRTVSPVEQQIGEKEFSAAGYR